METMKSKWLTGTCESEETDHGKLISLDAWWAFHYQQELFPSLKLFMYVTLAARYEKLILFYAL